MSDEIPSLESLLPAEVVAQIREIVAKRLSLESPPQASIGGQAALRLEANVFRPHPAAFGAASASVDTQHFLQVILNDPEPLKKRWASPEGVAAIGSIGTMIANFLMVAFLVEQGLETTAFQKEAAAFQKAALEQIEQFRLTHKDVPTPTPNPQPRTLGD